jgi:hypothetical protein
MRACALFFVKKIKKYDTSVRTLVVSIPLKNPTIIPQVSFAIDDALQ